MGRTLAIVLGILIFVVVLGIGGCAACIGIYNNLVNQEETLKAQYKQNQNNYDNMWKKFKEVASVPEMYTSDLKKVYDSTMQGRYGDKGSQAVMQWIQENNPNFDSSLYKQIQQVVEAGRNGFDATQKTLLDKKRIYEVQLRSFPTNVVAGVMGFPKVNLAEIDIVTSVETEKAFIEKKTDPIKLR